MVFAVSQPSQNSELGHGSPQAPSRDRFLSQPERFTFESVSTERETEEESSSCFDYTSDQVREVHPCFEFSFTLIQKVTEGIFLADLVAEGQRIETLIYRKIYFPECNFETTNSHTSLSY